MIEMGKLYIAGMIIYALGLLIGLYHEELKTYLVTKLIRRPKKDKKEQRKDIKGKDVMGKCLFIPQQLQSQSSTLSNTRKAPIQVPNEQLDRIFSERPESGNEL